MTLTAALDEVNHAILDLQQADYNTFERPLKKLANAFNAPELKVVCDSLKSAVDFDSFVEGSSQGGNLGSAKLSWPDDKEQEFGLILTLIERGANDPNWFMNFGFRWFYDGSKLIAGIRKMTKSIIIPFGRDFRNYVMRDVPAEKAVSGLPDKTKVFIVHGHDEAPRETVARFIEQQGLEAVILHEKANAGMSIPEKLIKHGDVGFAVVLLTPDDIGRAKTETVEKERARQNVILELGYFVGRLGREKVCALLKGTVDLPTDYVGVGYVEWDSAGAWKMQLARELDEAGYDIDFNKIMKAR